MRFSDYMQFCVLEDMPSIEGGVDAISTYMDEFFEGLTTIDQDSNYYYLADIFKSNSITKHNHMFVDELASPDAVGDGEVRKLIFELFQEALEEKLVGQYEYTLETFEFERRCQDLVRRVDSSEVGRDSDSDGGGIIRVSYENDAARPLFSELDRNPAATSAKTKSYELPLPEMLTVQEIISQPPGYFSAVGIQLLVELARRGEVESFKAMLSRPEIDIVRGSYNGCLLDWYIAGEIAEGLKLTKDFYNIGPAEKYELLMIELDEARKERSDDMGEGGPYIYDVKRMTQEVADSICAVVPKVDLQYFSSFGQYAQLTRQSASFTPVTSRGS